MKNSEIQALVGAKIRLIRKLRGYSQKEAAERIGSTDVYWGSVERGGRNVSLQSLSKIASALEVEVWELFQFQDIETDREIHDRQQVAAIVHSLLMTRTLSEGKMALEILRKVFETFDNESKKQ